MANNILYLGLKYIVCSDIFCWLWEKKFQYKNKSVLKILYFSQNYRPDFLFIISFLFINYFIFHILSFMSLFENWIFVLLFLVNSNFQINFNKIFQFIHFLKYFYNDTKRRYWFHNYIKRNNLYYYYCNFGW